MSKYLILGASSGIGRAVAEELAAEGHTLILASSNESRLTSVKDSLCSPDTHTVSVFDAREPESLNRVYDQAVNDGVKLDGVVYSVGTVLVTPLRTLKKEDIDSVFGINFDTFLIAASLFAKKKYSSGGSFVAVSAANAHYPQKCMSVYAASKGAIEAAVKTLALEMSEQNKRINAVIPGATETAMIKDIPREQLDSIVSKQLNGLLSPEDIADVICFLLSDKSRSITGRSIFADGGLLGQ
ncbi:MAG: SDR family oxidoreductase [Clostridiales bacterium]|nr:SDR family oxidoreductase [Clostridiales bacterium]